MKSFTYFNVDVYMCADLIKFIMSTVGSICSFVPLNVRSKDMTGISVLCTNKSPDTTDFVTCLHTEDIVVVVVIIGCKLVYGSFFWNVFNRVNKEIYYGILHPVIIIVPR